MAAKKKQEVVDKNEYLVGQEMQLLRDLAKTVRASLIENRDRGRLSVATIADLSGRLNALGF